MEQNLESFGLRLKIWLWKESLEKRWDGEGK